MDVVDLVTRLAERPDDFREASEVVAGFPFIVVVVVGASGRVALFWERRGCKRTSGRG